MSVSLTNGNKSERDARFALSERDARLALSERDARLALSERDARLALSERDARLALSERDARLALSEQDARTPKKDYLSMRMTYKKPLPQLEIKGGIYFITFNTYERLELSDEARKIVLDACIFFHEKRYYLYSAVVMSDHVHLLIKPYTKSEQEYWSIGSIMHSVKSYTANQVPKVMKHMGKVWQDGRYDVLIKSWDQFLNTLDYIRQNPVKEKYADDPEDYPFLWESF